MRNSVLTTDRQTDRVQVHVLSCASQLKMDNLSMKLVYIQQFRQLKFGEWSPLYILLISRGPIGLKSGSLWTSEFSVNSINLSSGYQRSLEDSTLDIEFTSIFCFIISTLLVFLFSLALALVTLKCYDYFKARNTQVFLSTIYVKIYNLLHMCFIFVKVSRFLCSSPPSYDTIAKIDRTELPTYKQACKFSLEEL